MPFKDNQPRRLSTEVRETSEVIDIGNLLTQEVTDTGSFDIRGQIWATTFGKVIQSLPIPAFLLDFNRIIIAVNQACARIHEDYNVIVGKSFSILFGNEQIADIYAMILHDSFNSRKTKVHETAIQIKNKMMWARLTFRPIRISSGRYMLVLAEDLTREKIQQKRNESLLSELESRVAERTQELTTLNKILSREIEERLNVELALRKAKRQLEKQIAEVIKNENNFRSVFEGAGDLIIIVGRDHRILRTNPAVENTLGYRPSALVSKSIFDLIITFGTKSRKTLFENAVLNGNKPEEVRVLCSDGSMKIVELTLSAIRNRMDKTQYFVLFLRDITERKRMEERLRQTAKMEAVGQLASGVAHDFNNLLTSIMGYADLMPRKSPLDQQQKYYLQQIGSAADKAAGLTRQLLAFGRKQILQMVTFDLNDLIRNLEGILTRLIRETIVLGTTFSDKPAKMYGDPGEIEQVLINLVVNARDAIFENGHISITTSEEVLDQNSEEVPAGIYTLLEVMDTGCGINPEILNKIFEPFFTTKPKGVGTGLGLATVYGIVNQHQGYLTVSTKLHQGTRFRLYFPVPDGNVEHLHRNVPKTIACNGTETILIVEDEELVSNLAVDGLSSLGYKVILASSPKEALDLCRDYDGFIHLLLTDIILPGMNGVTLYSQLVAGKPGMKVVYMSGYPEDVVAQMEPEMKKAFLRKPFNLDTLSSKIREILDGSHIQ